jgi:predicted cupin superfamily sugar epimerase
MDAAEIIKHLGLAPHPEGGRYRESWRAEAAEGERASGTAIYFLLSAGEVSRWHRVDAHEVWHFYAGGPLELLIETASGGIERLVLGTDLARGERPQAVVPAHRWQSARSLGEWTLVGCTVSPGFEFSGFELAPDGWEPGTASGA